MFPLDTAPPGFGSAASATGVTPLLSDAVESGPTLDVIGMRGAAAVRAAARRSARVLPFVFALLVSLVLHVVALAAAERAYAPYSLSRAVLNSYPTPAVYTSEAH